MPLRRGPREVTTLPLLEFSPLCQTTGRVRDLADPGAPTVVPTTPTLLELGVPPAGVAGEVSVAVEAVGVAGPRKMTGVAVSGATRGGRGTKKR